MKVSKFIKIDPKVLVEYIYNDSNLIGEDYKVLVNNLNPTLINTSFLSGDTSGTKNTQDNNLFLLDPVNNKWGKSIEPSYNFIQTKDYSSGIPVRYDSLKFHFPVSYNFDEYLGFNIRVYTLDYRNENFIDLSNYYFDISDVSRVNQLGYSTPNLLFQETLWGKNIEVSIPSVYSISKERENGNAKQGSVNSNLTNAIGLSQTSPILIDFHFITKKDVINNVTTYLSTEPKTISFPQTPEFENLGVKIEESSEGDYFEIFGIFNDNAPNFAKFISDSYTLGKRYYVQYNITIFEENIRGKSMTFTITDDFSEPIEFRPIIKFSTTTAVIDVEMKLIDRVDNSQITRKASYGMLSDQVSKYSLKLTKINIDNFNRVKIYKHKNNLEIGNLNNSLFNNNPVQFEQVKVPYPVMTDRHNVVAKSENVKLGKDVFYGLGKLQIQVFPFDNIFKFILANKINENESKIEYFDLSGNNDVKLVFKNKQLSVSCQLYYESGEIDLQNGSLSFRLPADQIQDVRSIFESGISVFYITTSFNNITTIIYSGTFKMYDSQSNINELTSIREDLDNELPTESQIIQDPDVREEAIITRRRVIKNSELNEVPKKVQKVQKGMGNFRRDIRDL